MSRVPEASPITPDIEEIRRRGEDENRPLPPENADAVPGSAPDEEHDREPDTRHG
ncbi:hypothetical protein [uncultured Aureimonas sp.]|uniref:hypothetical protein n=1 Tax=uncultured Aureimonas sp. TaxID=1604662 RepID=UPI0025CDA2F3|nr:hypothetical protein [uncultured Aureimonas sp.]